MNAEALPRAAAAEWHKLRSVRSTWWFAGGALLLMLTVAALRGESTAADLRAVAGARGSVEAATAAVAAAGWVNFVFGAFGMLAVTGEYATRSIMVTLACTPSRTRMLLAKTAVVGTAGLATGMVVAALGVAAGAPWLKDYWDFNPGQVAARIVAIGAYLALIAVLALGLGTVIRRSAGTLTVLFVLLLVVPPVLQGFASALNLPFLATVADFTPARAGERFLIGETAYGLVVAAWAVAAVTAGTWTLRARDA